MRWSRTVILDREVQGRQPTRSEIRKKLTTIREATDLLQQALRETAVREFLDAAGDEAMPAMIGHVLTLAEIVRRAERASKSPDLMKRGRGRALPSGTIPAQAYCALLIAETWKWFDGEYPPPHNMAAATAAGLYWRLAGGQVQSWGHNPSEAWRYHLRKIATLNAEGDREEYRRHLRETERRAELIRDGN
jgi:hypothetical protein